MTDYMKETERLTDDQIKTLLNEIEYGNMVTFDDYAYLIARKIEWHVRAALLAHIQRGVPEGWKEATIAWEVCASIHREYAKKKDPFFTTRQADFVRHTEAARAAMLAAAPDHFRDAAEMVAEPADGRIAAAIHYPECWDTAAYPTVESALSEVYAHYRCTEHDAPTDVPMPEPDTHCYDEDERRDVWSHSADQMRTYGDAREAAGYARGLAEAGRDAEPVAYLYTLEYGSTVVNTKLSAHQLNYPFGVCGSDYLARSDDGVSYVRQTPLYTAAALRVEVKP